MCLASSLRKAEKGEAKESTVFIGLRFWSFWRDFQRILPEQGIKVKRDTASARSVKANGIQSLVKNGEIKGKKKKKNNPVFYQLYWHQAGTVSYTSLTVLLQVCTLTQRDFFLCLRKQMAIPQRMIIAAGGST